MQPNDLQSVEVVPASEIERLRAKLKREKWTALAEARARIDELFKVIEQVRTGQKHPEHLYRLAASFPVEDAALHPADSRN